MIELAARRQQSLSGFSLVEVVLALGIVAFAIVAILGLVPTGLTASHASQDETRAAQIAQATFSGIQAQAASNFRAVNLFLNDGNSVPLDLTGTSGASTTPTFYSDNNGFLLAPAGGNPPANARYAIFVTTNSSPAGFDPGVANELTVKVAWPANAAAANQTFRSYVQIVTKY